MSETSPRAMQPLPAPADDSASAVPGARLSRVAVAYLLCIMLPVFFKLGPLGMGNLRLLLIVIVVPLLVRLYLGHFGKLVLPDLLFPLFILWTMLSLIRNNPEMAIENTGSTGIEFLGGYLCGRAYVRTSGQFLQLCRWLALIVCLLMPVAFIEAATGRLLLGEILSKLPGLGSETRNVGGTRLGLDRVQTVFAHPIHFGLFCSVAVSMVFVAMKGQMAPPLRFLVAALMIITGCLALSSGALLAMALLIALVTWAWIFQRLSWKWWLLLGMMALAYVAIDLLSNRSPMRVFLSYATMSAHTAYWRAIIFEWGMINVWENPLLGLGFNDWKRPIYMISGSMDNFWLVIAVRYGIPAFLCLALGVFVPLLRIIFRDFRADPSLGQLRLAWVLTFVCLSFTLSTVHIWGNIFSFVFFMFGAGMWMARTEVQVPGSDQGAVPEPGPGQPADDTAAPRSGQTPGTRDRRAPPRYTRFAPNHATQRRRPPV
ncbi:O-antigen ligase family protein [Salipiger sp. 1_MG-2023]|uniref:O-antigen ligase family protein n=1 Tax=Salipiger sp. 1_MG-2023 TaxID=3062665 RepID=UPI0026E3CBD5|nr:O-antigen ligase family protein [Salipiger sp. 1_MG-2023]MDO6586995.1 O-antigen ligase family protein [Salipiger sp. 1_MG-2023]